MSESGEIKIGESLLNHYQSLTEIMTKLLTAYDLSAECNKLINDGITYEGKAVEELQLFFSSLEMNINKLCVLYKSAAEYVINTYKTHYYNEEQLINWIISQLGNETE